MANYGRPADMSAQGIFNKVATHLIAQGERSTSPAQGEPESCAYRGADNKACAVGCLLTRDEAKRFEGWQWPKDGPPIDLIPFTVLLRRLQRVHDGKWPSDWPAGLRDVAREFGLTTEALS